MKKLLSNSISWDHVGISASLLCAVHCALLPLLLTASALGGLAWLDSPWLEISFISASFLIAGYSLSKGYLHHHHIFRAILIVIAGFTLIILSRFFKHGDLTHYLTAAGGLVIAYAHYVNWKLTSSCGECAEH